MEQKLSTDIFAEVKGRSDFFGNGYLPLMIEDVIRNELHAERDLTVTTVISEVTHSVLEIEDAAFWIDDYYNEAILHNVTQDWSSEITDFEIDGSSRKAFTITGTPTLAVDDNIYLTNVNCNLDSFYNTLEVRDDWVAHRVINKKMGVLDLLDELCYEFWSILIKSYDEYKLIYLDSDTEVGTLGQPMSTNNGVEFRARLSSPLSLYTDFKIKYAYNYAKRTYLGEIFCNKNGSSSASLLGTAYQTLCLNAEANYKISRLYEYQMNNVSDTATAYKFAQKVIAHLTFQKLIVTGRWSLNEAIKYEKGDLLKVNYPDGMPTDKNNSVVMMVSSKKVFPYKRVGYVELQLIELPT